jgi:predicted Zn-dependent protease
MSEAQEIAMGKGADQEAVAAYGLYPDTQVQAYVEGLGRQLAAASERPSLPWSFKVVDDPAVNAFALPGGYVYVTRGLLVLVNSEDELAGVIAHEIGHVAARHSVQQISRAAPLAVVTGLGAVVTGIVSPTLGRAVGGAGATASEVILAPYNRDQEREADRVGQDIMAAAGWDPAALSTFLRTLGRGEELSADGRRRPSLLDSHPSTPERVAATPVYARELRVAPRAPGSADRAQFLRRFDGLVVGRRASAGVFEGSRFLHPDLDFTLAFPDRWTTENSREQVGAVAPDQQAFIAVEVVAQGDDPLAGARAFQAASKTPVVSGAEPLRVGGLPAARARLRGRTDKTEVVALLTWIAYRGRVYQVAGVTPLGRSTGFEPVFEGVVQSFRPLSALERAGIREDRLRLVDARRGESVSALATRTGTVWAPAMIAVANELAPGAQLLPGQLVKVALPERYAASGR